MPPGSSSGPFVYTPSTGSGNGLGRWDYSGMGAKGFMACPVPAPATPGACSPPQATVYQVFANTQSATVPTGKVSDCLTFDALTASSNVTTETMPWEYI